MKEQQILQGRYPLQHQGVSRLAIISGTAILAGVIAGTIGVYFTMVNAFKAKEIRVKEAAGRIYVASMNTSQQAYFVENKAFASSVQDLGRAMKMQTENYFYSIRLADYSSLANSKNQAVFNYGISRQNHLRSYVGHVVVKQDDTQSTTLKILCEADTPGQVQPAPPTYENGLLSCGAGTHNLLDQFD